MPQTFVAPSGRKYRWQKDSPPTQADIDAIVAYENEIVAREKAGARQAAKPPGLSGRPEPVVEPFRPDVGPVRPIVGVGATQGAVMGARGQQPPQLPSFRATLGSDALKSKAAAKFFDKPQAKAPAPKPPPPSPRQAIDDTLRRAFEERAILPRQGETDEQFRSRQAIAQRNANQRKATIPEITTAENLRQRGLAMREVPPEELEQAVFEEMVAMPEDELRALVDERRGVWLEALRVSGRNNPYTDKVFREFEQTHAALEEKTGWRRLADPVTALKGLEVQAYKTLLMKDVPASERLMALVNTIEGAVTVASLGSKSAVVDPLIHAGRMAGRAIKPALTKALQAAGKYTSPAKATIERAAKALDDRNMAAFRNALDRLNLTDQELNPVVDDVVKHVEDLSAKLDDAITSQAGDVTPPVGAAKEAREVAPGALQVKQAEKVLQDVPGQPAKGAKEVPAEEGVGRVQPETQKAEELTEKLLAALMKKRAKEAKPGDPFTWENELRKMGSSMMGHDTPLKGPPNQVMVVPQREHLVTRLAVAYDGNGDPVGIMDWHTRGPLKGTANIIVRPDVRRVGIGTKLREAAEAYGWEITPESITKSDFSAEGKAHLSQYLLRQHPDLAAKYAKETPAAPAKTEGVLKHLEPDEAWQAIESGDLKVGDEFIVTPTGKRARVVQGTTKPRWDLVEDIERPPGKLPRELSREDIASELEDARIELKGLQDDLKNADDIETKANLREEIADLKGDIADYENLLSKYAKEPPVGKEPWEIRYDKGVAVGATRGDVTITKVRERSRKSSRGLEQGGEWFQVTIDGETYKSRLLGNVQAWADQRTPDLAAKYAKETPPAAPAPKPTGEVTHGDWTKGPNDSWRRGEYTVEPFAAGQWSIHGPGQRSGYWSGKVVGSLDHAKALVDADIADNPSQTFASIKAGAKPTGGVGKAHKGADPPEPPAPKPTKPAAVIQETPIPTTSKQAIPETTTTPAKKPPTKIQQAMEKASEERVSAYEAKEALKQDVEALRKAAKPTTGGAGSKKRGAVVDPSDTIGGIIDAARSMGVTKKVSAASEIGVSLFGNTLDRLKSLGASGREIAHDLSAIFDDAAKHTATYGFRLKETTRATFGKLYGISRSARTSLGIRGNGLDIVSKVESGKALSKSESRLWKEWVSIVKAVKANAKKFGVGVMDRVGSHPEGKQLIGTEVRWAADGKIKSGVVIATDANSITVQVGRGKDTVSLPSGLSFVREQLVDPDKFFPRVLRADVRSNLFREGSQVRSEAIGHLKKNGFANTDDEAAEIIREAFGQGVVEIHSPIASRLRRQRTGGLLPDSFYDRDFLSVAEKYIAQASMDIAAAKRWGKDYTLLTEKLAALPHGAKEAKDLIDSAISPRSLFDTQAHRFASAEGMYQAITKLTLPTTAFLQVTQTASTLGIMGARAFMKSAALLAKDLVTGREIIDTIKLSGVIDQDLLSLLGFADLRGVARDITGMATTPMRWTDRMSRVHAALAGAIHAQDMVGKVKVKNGAISNNAAYRWLEDWAEFTNADIIRMKETGMSADDVVRAMSAGTKTQVRTRAIDLAPVMNTPLGRIYMRFKTFMYGQARNVGWAVKEARKGNAVPLARLVIAGTVAGVGVEGFRDFWGKTREGIHNAVSERDVRELAGAWSRTELPEAKKLWSEIQDGFTGDDAKGVAKYVLDKLLDAGTLGGYGLLIEHTDPKAKWKKPLEPVSARLPQNIVDAIIVGMKSKSKNEKEFVDAMKTAGVELSKKEVFWVKEVYKMIDKGGAAKGIWTKFNERR